MSLQLVYTSAERLLDAGMTGYGVVARSEKMTTPLAKKIARLSNFKDFQSVKGPQYSYRIIDCAGDTYHILSCVQEAGSDYTGRQCHIAHHLALPKYVVNNLRQHKARPTPAGLMLALADKDFWYKSWTGEPTRQLVEAPMSMDNLIEVDKQPTWQKWTSHKANARAFSTAPYEHDCLILIPQEINSEEILKLVNESDWLDPSHGWGKTFTTHGESKDTFADTQRIFVIGGDAMVERAKRTGRPILNIHPELTLHLPSPAPIMDAGLVIDDSNVDNQLFAKPITQDYDAAASPIPSPPPATIININLEDEATESRTGRKELRRRKKQALLLPAAILFLLISVAIVLIYNQSDSFDDEFSPSHRPVHNQHHNPTHTGNQLQATLTGDTLPAALQNLLKNTPIVLENGAIHAGCIDGNAISLQLRNGAQSLLIEKSEQGEYLLTLIRDGEARSGGQLILKADTVFHSFTLNGQEAYLHIEYIADKKKQEFLLIPRYKQTIKLPKSQSPSKINIQITTSDIVLLESNQIGEMKRMQLGDTYLEQRDELRNDLPAKENSMTTLMLPQIKGFGDNHCVQSQNAGGVNSIYQWECQETQSNSPRVSNYRYHISTRRTLGFLLQEHFNQLCNYPCAGKAPLNDPFFSITTLYDILCTLDQDSSATTQQALGARYCKLYAQPAFSDLLAHIIPRELKITLSPSESSLQSEACITKRHEVIEQLMKSGVREKIKDSICQFLSKELTASISNSLQSANVEQRKIELHKAQSSEGKAIWTFKLK